jgi:hypothetical protein
MRGLVSEQKRWACRIAIEDRFDEVVVAGVDEAFISGKGEGRQRCRRPRPVLSA